MNNGLREKNLFFVCKTVLSVELLEDELNLGFYKQTIPNILA